MTTLAELRQASLKEQKQKEQSQHSAESAPPRDSDHQPEQALAGAVISTLGTTPLASANGLRSPARHLSSESSAETQSLLVEEPAIPGVSSEAARAERFFARIHDSLGHKTLHPAGAKVSADMPPALFHRAKRYCLDHGNITMRQVLIDLLTNYLDEEGY